MDATGYVVREEGVAVKVIVHMLIGVVWISHYDLDLVDSLVGLVAWGFGGLLVVFAEAFVRGAIKAHRKATVIQGTRDLAERIAYEEGESEHWAWERTLRWLP